MLIFQKFAGAQGAEKEQEATAQQVLNSINFSLGKKADQKGGSILFSEKDIMNKLIEVRGSAGAFKRDLTNLAGLKESGNLLFSSYEENGRQYVVVSPVKSREEFDFIRGTVTSSYNTRKAVQYEVMPDGSFGKGTAVELDHEVFARQNKGKTTFEQTDRGTAYYTYQVTRAYFDISKIE